MYKITKGMHNTFSRRTKRTCPKCGMSVPVYKGRYPSKCPNCEEPYVSDTSVLDSLINGSLSIDNILEMSSEDRKTIEYEKVMAEIVSLKLMDYLVGQEVSGGCKNIWLFFSESTPKESLRDLVNNLQNRAEDIKLYPWDQDSAKWVVSILNARSSNDAGVSGNINTKANMAGTVIPS